MAQFDRENVDFEDFQKFQISKRNFTNQFCGVYKARLATLSEKLLGNIKVKWSTENILDIVDLTKDEYKEELCIIYGTLYKHQRLKPSILQEIANELQVAPPPLKSNFCSSDDSLFLENDISRIKLNGNITAETLVTGLVIAVRGHGLEDGSFWVDDYCFPGPCLKPITQISSCPEDNGKFVLFISGLDLVNIVGSLALELLSDWIVGFIGNEDSQKEAAKLVQVIVAGNSVRGSPETFTRKGYFENKKKSSLFATEVHRAVHLLDLFVSKITRSCSVTLLPGEFDPTCHSLPQHSLHPHILPITLKEGGNFHGVTNPWIGKMASRIISGSSGQPILDIMKVSDTDLTPMKWLEKTLEWSHYSPTAPDTLAEYPYDKTDPFVIQEYSDIYFSGNMDEFETKLVEVIDKDDSLGKSVRLICIPKFSFSHTAVLVNLESLDTRPIFFGTM